MTKAYGIHWFRRDLRLMGNPALLESCKRHEGRVLGVFFIDPEFLGRPDIAVARFAFLLETLRALREGLREAGGDLLVLQAPPAQGFQDVFRCLEGNSRLGKPGSVSFNRDYEPFARARDARVTTLLESALGCEVHTERDRLLIEPNELRKGRDGFYQVFTPFSRKWLELLRTDEIRGRLKSASRLPELSLRWPKDLFADALEPVLAKIHAQVRVPLPKAGERAAKTKLKKFRAANYAKLRDLPGHAGTSGVSIYLKNGSLTVAQIISTLKLEKPKKDSGEEKFLKELIWREFYHHILHHCPGVETQAFQPKYRQLEWENNEAYFEAWKEGRTGYSLVDAGMRQLKQTGWMHNRVRMVVASFLTKDLLVDWRWGERYFMQNLLDGDLAANNGGWQWAASTGCDPQPYFRIFNPTEQARKFDPQGDYIRHYVPEREKLNGKAVHEPLNPIVDHAKMRERALASFRRGRRAE